MNIAKDYLSQTYTAQGKIMCYNLMIESMQKIYHYLAMITLLYKD